MAGPRVAYAVSILSILLVGLAGCTSSGGDPTPSGSSSSSTGPAAPPLVARIAWGPKDGNASASAPLAVGTVLAFDASNSTGPVAGYAWDFGDNATSANKRAEHAYSALGNYTVTLTVSSLDNATATATVQVNVTSAPGQPLFRQHVDLSGELPLMNPNSCTTQDVDCRDHVVPVASADANGTAAVANHVRVNVTGSSSVPGAALQVFWRAPDGTTLAQTEASGLEHALEFVGSMGPGDYVVRVRLFTGAQASYTGTVDVDYVTVAA